MVKVNPLSTDTTGVEPEETGFASVMCCKLAQDNRGTELFLVMSPCYVWGKVFDVNIGKKTGEKHLFNTCVMVWSAFG